MISNSELTIVMYHYVRPIAESNFPKLKGLELKDFRNQLDYLEKNFNTSAAYGMTNTICSAAC